jgi:hypothetical protein
MRFLLVEDEGVAASTGAAELQQAMECETTVVADPAEALVWMRSKTFNLVVADMLYGQQTDCVRGPPPRTARIRSGQCARHVQRADSTSIRSRGGPIGGRERGLLRTAAKPESITACSIAWCGSSRGRHRRAG